MTTERQAEIRDRLTAAGYPTPVGVRRHVWADTYAKDVGELLAEIERLNGLCRAGTAVLTPKTGAKP